MSALDLQEAAPVGSVRSDRIWDRRPIRATETVVFFPTYGSRRPGGRWRIPISGAVFDLTKTVRKRAAILAAIRRYLGRRLTSEELETFHRRAGPFRASCRGGRHVEVHAHAESLAAGPTQRNGVFRFEAEWRETPARRQARGLDGSPFAAALPPGDGRRFELDVDLIPEEGWSVISDIDDTIKQTGVHSRREMLRSTFLDPFQAVPGMAELYSDWQARGAAFHYVSASPWQLCEPLCEFFATSGIPRGSMDLKLFRPRVSSMLRLFGSPFAAKLSAVDRIMQAFPRRRFILVGDSAARDAQVYAEAYRRRRHQVHRILIRITPEQHADANEWRQALNELPRERWEAFREPDEIQTKPPEN